MDINKIYSGQIIVPPKITKEDLIVKGEKNDYHVHYASFFDIKNAKKTVKTLQSEGLETFWTAVDQGDNKTYRVFVGTFFNKVDAKKMLASLDLKFVPFLNAEGSI